MTYKEKLLDPRWQKKRLEILRRDGFACQLCRDKETTLHVHHDIYQGDSPWDTDDENLFTYCKHCHKIVELNKNDYQFTLRSVKMYTNNAVKIYMLYIDKEGKVFVDVYLIKGEVYTYLTSISKSVFEEIYEILHPKELKRVRAKRKANINQ